MAGGKSGSDKNNLDMAWAEYLEKESRGAETDVNSQEMYAQNNDNVYMNDVTNVQPAKSSKKKSAETLRRSTQPGPDRGYAKDDYDTSNANNSKDNNIMDETINVKEETVNIDSENPVVNETDKVPEKEVSAKEDDKKKLKKEKKEKKDKKDAQIEELQDKLVRTMAEFDNFRKRTEKEKTAMFEVGAKSVIEKVLPVIDNFERGLDAVSDEEKNNAFVQGVDKIYKQFMTTLEDIGVKPIEATGKEFDPNFHNAVMHVDDEELGENVVAEEFQKGYMYRESVVRHSMVKVAN